MLLINDNFILVMRKIKLLRGLIIALEIALIARSVAIIMQIPLDQIRNIITNTPVLLFIGLIYIERGLFYNIKIGYFNIQSALKLKRGGLFLMFSGFISLIKNTFILYDHFNTPEIKVFLIRNITQSLLISIIGFGIIVISDFIKKGNTIQNENDLTV